MPGARMIGDYTAAEISSMSREDFEAAQAREFAKPQPEGAGVLFPMPVASTANDFRGEIRIGNAPPHRPTAPANPNAWASAKKDTEDFTCPSGQICKLRRVSPEELLEVGILDRVSRLEGLAESLVGKAEGQPPAKETLPTREEFGLLLETVNVIVPLAVLEPKVWPDNYFKEHPDEQEPEGAIFVSDIELEDRIAIMERSMSRVKRLDSFRNS